MPMYRRSIGRIAAVAVLPMIYVGCSGESAPDEVVESAASAVETCITVQRGNSGTVADALLRSDKVTTNYGSSASLTASIDATSTRHAVLSWDISGIPSGSTVSAASATLKVLLQGGAIVNAHRVTQAWGESTVTWGNAPTVSSSVAATFPSATAGQTTTADMTALVQGWVDGTYQNYGIMVERDGATGMTVFSSSEDSTVATRPSLYVCYTPPAPCGGGCTPVDDCHDAACNQQTNQCVQTPKANGTACNDGDANTSNDVCQSGVCQGTAAASWQIWGGSGSSALCATKAGVLKCWGFNGSGQLGLGDTASRGDGANEMGNNLPGVNLGTGRTAVAATTGSSHACALLDNGQVKCWGANGSGWLGVGDYNNRGDNANEMGDNLPAINLGTGRTALAISSGTGHVCAVLDNHQVKCWGYNYYGQLGLGDTNVRGEMASQMGDNLPAVDLGTGRTALSIVAGGTHTCALLDNHQLKCWGSNINGELGLGDTLFSHGGAPGEMGDNLAAVDVGTGRTVNSLTAGYGHTCALLDNSQLKCWGDNFAGQLGLGHTSPRGLATHQMGDNLLAVDLGTGRTALSVNATPSVTCALLDNHQVKCWGWNLSGDLGLGDTAFRGDNANEMGNNLPVVSLGTGRTATWAGYGCAQLDNGQNKCWGSNASGRLGLGNVSARGDGPNEMGDNLPAIDLGN